MRSHNVTVFEFNPKSRVGQRLIDDTLHLNGFFFRQGIFFSLELKGWRIVQKPRSYCNERFQSAFSRLAAGSGVIDHFSYRMAGLQALLRRSMNAERGIMVAPRLNK